MKKKLYVLSLSFMLVCTNITSVFADEKSMLTNSEIINELDKENFESEEFQENGDGAVIELEDATVQIPNFSEELVIIENFENNEYIETGMGIAVNNPTEAIIENDIVFYLDEENYSASIQVSEGSIRQSFIIGSSSSPEEFEMDIKIPENGYMEFAEIYGQKDGSVVVYDGDSQPIAAIGIPWATDSTGKDIHTFYKIEGNKLIQTVKHRESNTTYPLVADPTLTFSSYFSSGKWIERGGTYSTTLSLKPKAVTLTAAGALLGWAKVKGEFQNTKKWKNEGGLSDQYMCHQMFAALKNEWNLEPARPNVGMTKTIAANCNPTK